MPVKRKATTKKTTKTRAHLVKGSLAAKQHMAKIRAMKRH
jgi:hypothetical protein